MAKTGRGKGRLMYLSTLPGPNDAPSHLHNEWQEEEQAMNSYEGLAEFGAVGRVDEERVEREHDRMLVDSTYVYWSER